jgi:hypothetical protein
MKKEYDCTFNYECSCDLDRFFKLLEKNRIYCTKKETIKNGDVRCVFETATDFRSTIKYLGLVDTDDLHVIFETINFSDKYTGNRDKALLKRSFKLIANKAV